MASANFDLKSCFDVKSLTIALGGVVGFYLLLMVYSMFAGPTLLVDLQGRLTHKTVPVSAFVPVEVEVHHEEALPVLPDEHAEVAVEVAEAKQLKAVREIGGLFERSNVGNLPVIRKSDGLTPFTGYRKPFSVAVGTPRVAIAFQGIGLSSSLSKRAIEELPEEVSLIVSPYAGGLKGLQQDISKAGHEMWLSVPVEDMDYPMSEPGSQGILSRSSEVYNLEKLHWAMGRTFGYAGVAMYFDDAFAGARNVISVLGEDIFARGLGYLDMNAAASYGLDVMAAGVSAPYLVSLLGDRDLVFEDVADDVLDYTKTRGAAVVVLPATPVNIDFVKGWAQVAEDAGVALVPLSAVYSNSSAEEMVEDGAHDVDLPHAEGLSQEDVHVPVDDDGHGGEHH